MSSPHVYSPSVNRRWKGRDSTLKPREETHIRLLFPLGSCPASHLCSSPSISLFTKVAQTAVDLEGVAQTCWVHSKLWKTEAGRYVSVSFPYRWLSVCLLSWSMWDGSFHMIVTQRTKRRNKKMKGEPVIFFTFYYPMLLICNNICKISVSYIF